MPVGLSTASVWPQKARAAFEYAAELGYDGVEVMVWGDKISQDPDQLLKLSEQHGVPILAVHAPCLLITQRVWSPDPIIRLRRAVEHAQVLGAKTVVVHPPFRWQRSYVEAFSELVAELEQTSGIVVAVENMFSVHPAGRKGKVTVTAFKPSWDPTDVGYPHYTLDLSHTAAAGVDALELAKRMGDGLAHVHLADGSGAAKDEHLVPGRGTQPCAQICEELAAGGFSGAVVLEVSTRKAANREQRAELLRASLTFAKLHLDTA
ncbi:sugar phosphate isomerase/epimerase [Pseudonocardiaceae bacterium YIM PH 21723]|nr:sugar phosphate isomerase/epimerase [Pseudonocardiaceae bacterium YIM PH 21723]